MNAEDAALYLSSYVTSVPDVPLLEYLLTILRNIDEVQSSKDDLIYSLMPELALLDEVSRSKILKDLSSSSVFNFKSNSTRRTDDMRITSKTNPNQKMQEDDCEYEPVRLELQHLLVSLGCNSSISTIDNAIVGFLLQAFAGTNENNDTETYIETKKEEIGLLLDKEEQLELLRAYLDVPEESLLKISTFFAKSATDLKEKRNSVANAAAELRTSELTQQLQSIADNQRSARRMVSAEEAAQRAQLVDKFGEVEVRAKYDSKGKEIKSSNFVLFVPNSKAESKVRYRDGVVVSHGGEKYIVEKQPEYDSGCRGRVKPKGKRGAGVGKGL